MAFYKVNIHVIYELEGSDSYEEVERAISREIANLLGGKSVEREYCKISKLKNSIHKIFLGEYKPDDVLKYAGRVKKFRVDGKSYKIDLNSPRYILFKENRYCVGCGIEGVKMILEMAVGQEKPHFNLYAEEDGRNILMTKDHIVAKANGGDNCQSNYQTMCSICNNLKANAPLSLETFKKLRKIYDENKKDLSKKKLSNLIKETRYKLITGHI